MNKIKKPSLTVTIPLLPFAVLLVVLKVTGVIHISWLWAFSPLWLPLAFMLLMLAVFVMLTLTIAVLQVNKSKGKW